MSSEPDPTAPSSDALINELAGLSTEAIDPGAADLDTWPTLDLVTAMNQMDRTVPATVATQLPQIAAAVDGVTERLRRGGRLFYLGSGTAGRIGALDASEIPPTYGTTPDIVQGLISGGPEAFWVAKEGAEDDAAEAVNDLATAELTADDAVVGISASGRTPYAVAGVSYARTVGAFTIGLAGNSSSALGDASECAIEVVTGPEFIAGSTRLKAGTAQKLVLNMISTCAMVRLGKTYGNIMVDLRATNAKLRARSIRILTGLTEVPADQAQHTLDSCDGSVKLALLVLWTGLDPDAARARLAAHSGNLREALAQ